MAHVRVFDAEQLLEANKTSDIVFADGPMIRKDLRVKFLSETIKQRFQVYIWKQLHTQTNLLFCNLGE